MAHIDVEHFSVRPAAAPHETGSEVQRTQSMLVLAGAGAMMIVVTAALFMTMF